MYCSVPSKSPPRTCWNLELRPWTMDDGQLPITIPFSLFCFFFILLFRHTLPPLLHALRPFSTPQAPIDRPRGPLSESTDMTTRQNRLTTEYLGFFCRGCRRRAGQKSVARLLCASVPVPVRVFFCLCSPSSGLDGRDGMASRMAAE